MEAVADRFFVPVRPGRYSGRVADKIRKPVFRLPEDNLCHRPSGLARPSDDYHLMVSVQRRKKIRPAVYAVNRQPLTPCRLRVVIRRE